MDLTTASKLKTRSLMWAAISITGLAAFCFIMVFPNYRRLHEKDVQINNLKEKIKNQDALKPLFHSIIKKSNSKLPDTLPFHEAEPVLLGEVVRVTLNLEKMIAGQRFTVLSVRPEPNEIMEEAGLLPVYLVLNGAYNRLKPLFFGLYELPYCDRVETVSIRAADQASEIHVKMWIKVK